MSIFRSRKKGKKQHNSQQFCSLTTTTFVHTCIFMHSCIPAYKGTLVAEKERKREEKNPQSNADAIQRIATPVNVTLHHHLSQFHSSYPKQTAQHLIRIIYLLWNGILYFPASTRTINVPINPDNESSKSCKTSSMLSID